MSLKKPATDVFFTVGTFPVPDESVDLDDEIAAWRTLTETRRTLTHMIEDLENVIGKAMADKRYTSDGVTVERARKANRTQWDTESLRRIVLDSRIVDETTGEVKDETPVDKLLHVWNLPAPRTTALKARGIDPDEFCSTERFDRWTLRAHQ